MVAIQPPFEAVRATDLDAKIFPIYLLLSMLHMFCMCPGCWCGLVGAQPAQKNPQVTVLLGVSGFERPFVTVRDGQLIPGYY